MIFYHGSSIGGLTRLKPFISEHGKPYIYFSTNPIVALLYAVKPVPKPFSFYPYGFDNDGAVVFSEYYENAFFDIYISEKEMGFILSELEKDVITYKLNDNPKHPMSIFLKAHFQSVLEKNEKKQ